MPDLFPILRICVSVLCDVAYATSLGVLLNRLWLGEIEIGVKRLHTSLKVCSLVMLAGVPLQFLLLSASMTGDESWKAAWSALPDVAATHSGRALIAGLCFVVILVAFSLRGSALRNRVPAGIAIMLCFLASRAFYGHAASDGDFTLREGVQFLHLCAISAWGGGVVVAGLITVPQLAMTGLAVTGPTDTDAVVRFARRLSQTVTVALGVVILSGLYNAWKGLGGSLAHLPDSSWGRMLLLKVLFVILALGHGARVRLLLRKDNGRIPDRPVLMPRWLRVEALLMLVVLICSGWLANLPPADM